MCLAIPGRIVAIEESEAQGRFARIDYGIAVKTAQLLYLPDAQVGDYVIVHAARGGRGPRGPGVRATDRRGPRDPIPGGRGAGLGRGPAVNAVDRTLKPSAGLPGPE